MGFRHALPGAEMGKMVAPEIQNRLRARTVASPASLPLYFQWPASPAALPCPVALSSHNDPRFDVSSFSPVNLLVGLRLCDFVATLRYVRDASIAYHLEPM